MPISVSAPAEDGTNVEPWVSITTAAEYYEISTRTVHRMVAAGRIPVLKVGRATRVRIGDIEAASTLYPVIDL